MSDSETNLVRLGDAIASRPRADEAPVRRSFKRMKTEETEQPYVSERPTLRLGGR